MLNKKILVVYLCTKYVNDDIFFKFIKNYKKYPSGIKHKLLICFKNIDKSKIKYLKSKITKLNYDQFDDASTQNDWDFMSFYRIAKKYKDYLIFFLNNQCYPIKKKWLWLVTLNYKNKRVLGTSGSYESISSRGFLRNQNENILFYLFRVIKYLINFPLFPNPHIRTSNFMISGKDYLKYKFEQKYSTKFDSLKTESGRNSITNFFKKKGFELLIINSEGKAFSEEYWKFSETYCYKNQNKLIISDRRTRKYQNFSLKNKKEKTKIVWG
jgi:hypothetical protein